MIHRGEDKERALGHLANNGGLDIKSDKGATKRVGVDPLSKCGGVLGLGRGAKSPSGVVSH